MVRIACDDDADLATSSPPAHAPHPPLTAYYPDPAGHATFVRRLFDATAGDYDRLNDVFSFGAGRRYRARALRLAGIAPGAHVLDVATGTGMVAQAALALAGPSGSVTALDLSAGMLRLAGRHAGVRLVQGSMDRLPFADGRFDVVTQAYALRHVESLDVAFAEFARVLRPGGRLLLMEIARPDSRIGMAVTRAYLGRVVPLLSRLAGSGRQAETLMRFYWDTIESCVPAATILAAMRAGGLRQARCATEFGVFKLYTATRPPSAGAGTGAGTHSPRDSSAAK